MAKVDWIKSERFTGVRWYKHPSRKGPNKIAFDRCFGIRYQANGKRYEAVLGWESDGWSESDAHLKRKEYIKNAKDGVEEVTPKLDAAKKRLEAELQNQKNRRLAAKQARKNITLSEFWDKTYYAAAQRARRASTVRVEEQHYRIWLSPDLGDRPLRDIEANDLEMIQNKMETAGKSKRTIQHAFSTFRLIWNAAKARKIVSGESPTSGIKLGKLNNERVRFLKPEESRKLLDTIKKDDEHAYRFTLAALYTGARLGELSNIAWGNVDLAAGSITLVHTKTGKPRSIPVAQPLAEVFSGMTQGLRGDLVFTDRQGRQYKEQPWAFRKAVRELKLNEGVEEDRRQRISFHSLRHTAASLMLAAGVDLRTIQGLFGWSTLQMLQRYTHVVDEAKGRAIRGLENMLEEKSAKVVAFRRVAGDDE